MKKVIEKGAEFPAKEAKRLKGMIDGGKVKAEKIDEFYYRMNIMKCVALPSGSLATPADGSIRAWMS
jgi:hypothetical protein